MATRVTRDRLSRDPAPDPLARLHARQPPWLGAHIAEAAGPLEPRSSAPIAPPVVNDPAPQGHWVHEGGTRGDASTDGTDGYAPGGAHDVDPSTPAWLDPATRVAAVAGPPPTDHDRRDRDAFGWSDVDRGRFGRTDRPDHGGPRRRSSIAPPAAIALVVVGVLACVVTVVAVASGGSDDAPTSVAFPASAGSTRPDAPASGASPDSAPMPSEPSPSDPAQLVVSVVGLVRTPGLVRLPAASRIADAIAAAGGGRPGADLLSLNMAQPIKDGDQVLVGYSDPKGGPSLRSSVVGGTASAGGGAPASGAASAAVPSAGATTSGSVDLNTADEQTLDALPGVGPVTAKAIVDWRTRNGRFTSVEQLAEVDGIGPARLARLRDLVHV